MNPTILVTSLQEAIPGALLESASSVDLQTTIYVSRDHMPDIARVLRDRPDLRFAFLAELTAVDFWQRDPRFDLMTNV